MHRSLIDKLEYTIAGRQQLRCFSSVQEQIIQKNIENPVMIYSKSYCPFCHQVKDLFRDELKADAKFAELDELGADFDILHLCFCASMLLCINPSVLRCLQTYV